MTTDKNITAWIKHLPFRASKTALGTELYLNAQKTEFIFPSLSADMKGTNGMVVKQENNFRILPLSKSMHQYRCQFARQCWRIKNELFAQKILQRTFTTKLGNPVKFQRLKSFDICFCKLFDCYCQSLISVKEISKDNSCGNYYTNFFIRISFYHLQGYHSDLYLIKHCKVPK